VFVTNNSTKSRKQYGKKFESLGLSVTEEEIFASSFAGRRVLQVHQTSPRTRRSVLSCSCLTPATPFLSKQQQAHQIGSS